jgi:hypothetical protein
VRERLHERGVYGQNGIKQMHETDAVGLGNEPEEMAIPVETPGSTVFDDFKPLLIVPVLEFVCDFAQCVLIGQFQSISPHCTLTTVTSVSGSIPRTTASG